MSRFLPLALLLLAGCATTSAPPTPSECSQWNAALAAAQAGLPPLEAAVAQALTPQQKNDAQAALAAAQVLVVADQAYLAGRCGPPT